jgi:hypothetical protein
VRGCGDLSMEPVQPRTSRLAVGLLVVACVLIPTACGDAPDDLRGAGAPVVGPADCGTAFVGTWRPCPVPTNEQECPVDYRTDPEDLEAACADDLRCSYEPVPGTGSGPEPIGAGCYCQINAEGESDWVCGV